MDTGNTPGKSTEEKQTRASQFLGYSGSMVALLNWLGVICLFVGGPIYLIFSAVRSPVGARNFLIMAVVVGISLVPIHLLFRNAKNSPWNGLLLVLTLLILTICLMPLAVALFS